MLCKWGLLARTHSCYMTRSPLEGCPRNWPKAGGLGAGVGDGEEETTALAASGYGAGVGDGEEAVVLATERVRAGVGVSQKPHVAGQLSRILPAHLLSLHRCWKLLQGSPQFAGGTSSHGVGAGVGTSQKPQVAGQFSRILPAHLPS